MATANNRNLEPGQFQIGNFIFGTNTLFNVKEIGVAGYDINVQDYQISMGDDINFGIDTLKALPLQITINVRRNRSLPNILSLVENDKSMNFRNDREAEAFAAAWRAKDVLRKWGQLMPLSICRADGRVVQIYGRPGKFSITKTPRNDAEQTIVAEFRRADPLAYTDFEWYATSKPNEIVRLTRASELGMGYASSHLRFLIVGPMTHPIIQFGSTAFELDYEIEQGEIIEVSSYPWSRRVIKLNDGTNLSTKLIGTYLEKLTFPADEPIEFSWNATDVNINIVEQDFSTYLNGDVPPGIWDVGYSSPDDGQMIIEDGLLIWSDDGNDRNLAIARYRLGTTVTSYQQVKCTIKDPTETSILGEEESANRIIGRCNESKTEYVFWHITSTAVWFGYHRDGVDFRLSEIFELRIRIPILRYIWNEILDLFTDIRDNWIYTAEFGTGAGPLASTLKIFNITVATYEGDSPFYDSNHLWTAIGMLATPRALGQQSPGTISHFEFRDNAPADVMNSLNVSGVHVLWRDSWFTL